MPRRCQAEMMLFPDADNATPTGSGLRLRSWRAHRSTRSGFAEGADRRRRRDRSLCRHRAGRDASGRGCRIGPHAVVNGPTVLGADNQVFQFASIGDAPQDKKYKGEPTRLEVGDRNVFREYVTVNRGTVTGLGVTRIGNDNLLLAYSHVAHDCVLGNHIVLSNVVMLAGHVELGDWVIMSGYAGAHQFAKVGAHAFIGNNTAVTRDVPPYVLATGQPAEPRSVNSEGLKRRGFSEEQIRAIRNAYRVLYRSDLQAGGRRGAAAARWRPSTTACDIFVDFIGAVDAQPGALTARRDGVTAAAHRAGSRRGLRRPAGRGADRGAARSACRTARSSALAGERMRAAGCEPLGSSEELAVMGFVEPLRHLPRLLRLRSRLLRSFRRAAASMPSSASTRRPSISAWRAGCAQRGMTTVQYVSPQVWAWRPGRVRSIAAVGGRRAVPAAFRAGVLCRAAGARGIRRPSAGRPGSAGGRTARRRAHALGLPAMRRVVALLPGSRMGEVNRLGADFAAAAALLAALGAGAHCTSSRPWPRRSVAACLHAAGARLRAPRCSWWNGRADQVLAAADAALVASGTATLQTTAVRLPHGGGLSGRAADGLPRARPGPGEGAGTSRCPTCWPARSWCRSSSRRR